MPTRWYVGGKGLDAFRNEMLSDVHIKELYDCLTPEDIFPNPNADRRVNTLLSGLEKIISAVAEMRNKDGDAHGVGAARLSIEEHHARLFVNAAISMADFILSVENKQNT